MPNSHYYRARAKWATAAINWASDDIRAHLVSNNYTADLTNHEFLAAIVVGNRIGSAQALTGKAVQTDGRCTAASPLVFGDVGSTGTVKGMVLFKWTGSDATSPLLVWMDEAISGLPVAMSGAPVHVTLPAAGLILL